MAEPPQDAATERARALTREGNALREQGRWQEALTLLYQAVRIDPHNAAPAHNLAVLLAKLGRLAEGEAMSRHALSRAPNTPMILHALSHNLLGQGRFKEGFSLYRVRALMPELNTGVPRNFPFTRWNGEPLAGKRVVIFPEQGLGDQIQFARFLPRLIAGAGTVTLLTVASLERLFEHNFPQVEMIRAAGTTNFSDPDYWATMYDLAGVFVKSADMIPGEPYLRAPGSWPALGDGFKIGLKTKGNPKHNNDKWRSLLESDAKQLRTSLPGRIVSLEPDDSGAQDMADTAAIIEQLDLVVSVDTSVAHLAGALGKPCLLLLPGYGADWRWMAKRDDSLWYPGHHLFRGKADGDWSAAVDQVVAEAKRRAAPAEPTAPIVAPKPASPKGGLADMLLRGQALSREGRHPEALDLLRKALRQAPANPAALQLFGAALLDVGRLKEAEQYQRRALATAPDHPIFRNMLAQNLLAQGRYREAWPLHDGRSHKNLADIGFPTDVPCARWAGEPLAGKHIAVLPEQGFGDAIQFARFLPRLRETGARITLFAQPALADLFKTSFPGIEVRAAAGQVRLGNPDYWTTLIDMMGPLDIALEDVPSSPYLATDRAWPRFADGYKIGVVTSGNPNHTNDRHRSLNSEAAKRLAEGLPGTVVSLDPRVTGARDFADTAVLIRGLDLVVSVDTAVAHLAGALGKPCLLLLPSTATDWRWMRGRDNTPWYPGHRLFRSAADGSWDDAIDQLSAHAATLREAQKAAPDSARPKSDRRHHILTESGKAASAEPETASSARKYGGLLTQVGDLEKGEAALRRAVGLGGDEENRARFQLALNLLSQGRYAEAWPFYRARREIADLGIGYPRGINGPRWEGQPLAGKRLLILAEQGMGDTLQLARFLPALLTQGARVTLFERPPLVSFLQAAFPSTTVRSIAEIASAGPQDLWTTTFDMLEYLGVGLTNLPAASYARTLLQPHIAGSGFSVGLCTSGSAKHLNDRKRSLSADAVRRLKKGLPDTIVDLDPAKSGAKTFLETVEIMAQLDIVVSVDTAVAHLAGALDKSCLLLLPGFDTDWRWLRGRQDSPWYPRHRLYRSTVDADWDDAIDALINDVQRVEKGGVPFSAE